MNDEQYEMLKGHRKLRVQVPNVLLLIIGLGSNCTHHCKNIELKGPRH